MGERPAANQIHEALSVARAGVWSYEVASGAVHWSPELERIYGIPEGSFEGTFDAYLALQIPELADYLSRKIEQALLEKSQKFVVDHWVEPQDGTPRVWLEGWGRVLLDDSGEVVGMAGVVRDATERREEQVELNERRRQLELIAEMATDYVYSASAVQPNIAARIVAGSFERIVGYTPQEVAERGGWITVILEEDRPTGERMFGELLAGRPVIGEYRIRDAFGQVKWVRDRARPVMLDGKLNEIFGGVQDITKEKQLEQQLLESQKLEALAQLSSSVAHDFNNLLTVMISAMESLPSEVLGMEAVVDLRESIERSAELSQSLLAFARHETPQREIVFAEKLVLDSRTMLRRAAGPQNQVVISVDAEHACVLVDPGQLKLVLLNLVVNARDAEPKDGKITVGAKPLNLKEEPKGSQAHLLAEDDYLEIFVEDTGAGIDRTTQAQIFDPLFTTKAPGRGTGLGLSTAKRLVRTWDGEICVESEVGQGTRMRIFLPLTREGTVSRPVHALPISVGGTERIVLVDSDSLLLRATARALSEHGYRVEAYANPDELLVEPGVLLGASLVVADVRLPKYDVFSYIESLREHQGQLAAILTGTHLEDEELARLSTSAWPFLSKPFSPLHLCQRIRQTLDQL